ncbi:MAG: hypothetical protein IKQ71_05965 [Lachnospiraceae bacterium]|nr:hypothetical protein [Lachnospiraceae bacterium]
MAFSILPKKEKYEYEPLELCPGVKVISPVSMETFDKKKSIFVKALLLAMIPFSSLAGFLSAFEVNYYVPIVLVIDILAALFFTYIYTLPPWKRDICYVLFFFAFLGSTSIFNVHLNSGFYAVVNIVLERASDYFDTTAMQSYAEAITNRTVTVTVMACYFGVVSVIVLNPFFSAYMSVFIAVIFSVPVYIIPLFFENEPDSLYMIILFSAIFVNIFLNYSGHFKEHKKPEQFEYTERGTGFFGKIFRKLFFKNFDEKTDRSFKFYYDRSWKAIGELMVVALSTVLVTVVGINSVLPKDSFTYRTQDSSIKAQIKDDVSNFLLMGMASLFDAYDSTGGMNAGQLGGVASVYNDYQTDLIATFVPRSYDTVYLKSFIGESYMGDHWEKCEDNFFAPYDKVDGDTKATMDIRYVGADTRYLLAPYYTDMNKIKNLDSGVTYREDGFGINFGDYIRYDFYPINEKGEKMEDVDPKYLEVPDLNKEAVAEFAENAGLSGTPEEIVKQVADYYEENYPYTLRPGSLPRKTLWSKTEEDFVNYFLQKNKKGFCVHFATAATLIFRYMGIPARYVEGYVIPYSAVMDGELLEDKKVSDYYVGENPFGESAVVKAEVNDSMAHAWCEVLIDGKWVVAETTPPSDEEEDYDDIWTLFGRLLNGGNQNDVDDNGATNDAGVTFSMDELSWVWKTVLVIILSVVLFFVFRFSYKKLKRIISYHRRDAAENTVAYYRYICNYMRIAFPEFNKCASHKEQLEFLTGEKESVRIDELSQAVERISYGTGVEKEFSKDIKNKLKLIFREGRGRLSYITRFYLFFKI